MPVILGAAVFSEAGINTEVGCAKVSVMNFAVLHESAERGAVVSENI